MQRDDSSVRGEADEPSSELERRVERVHALVQATAVRLSRCQAEQGNGGAASDDLRRMGPHLQGALAALADLERRRRLTDEETSQRRAFKMLVEATRQAERSVAPSRR